MRIAEDLDESDPLLDVVLVCFLMSFDLPLKTLLVLALFLHVLPVKRLLDLAIQLEPSQLNAPAHRRVFTSGVAPCSLSDTSWTSHFSSTHSPMIGMLGY
jgi:hypothetical protein